MEHMRVLLKEIDREIYSIFRKRRKKRKKQRQTIYILEENIVNASIWTGIIYTVKIFLRLYMAIR